MRSWVAVDNGVVVHSGLHAEPEFIEDFVSKIVEPSNISTPYWWNEGVMFEDVTDLNPRPVVGYFKTATGVWIDGRPSLDVSRGQIPSDGTTAAIATFKQIGKNSPKSVVFNVNGVKSDPQLLTNGSATIEVVSSTPGDVIVITVGDLETTLVVEG